MFDITVSELQSALQNPNFAFSYAMSFDRLDEDCLATILSFLPPVEICAAATVCTAWRDASRLDTAWTRVVPGRPSMLAEQSHTLASAANMKERARALVTGGVHLDDDFHLSVHPRTKAVRLSCNASK